MQFIKNIVSTPLRKIVFINLTATLGAIFLVGSFQYFISTNKGLSHAEEHLSHISSLVSLRIEELMNSAKRDVEFIAALPDFASLPYTDQIDLAINGLPEHVDSEKRAILDEMLVRSSFSVFFLLRPNGDHYISHPFVTQKSLRKGKYNLSGRDYFQEAAVTKQTTLSDSLFGANSIPAIAIDVPILNENNEIVAHLGGAFYLDDLSKILKETQGESHFATAFILDKQNNLIAHSKIDSINEELRVNFKKSPALTEVLTLHKKFQPSRNHHHNLYHFVDDETGDEQVGYVMHLNSGWHLIMTKNWEHILGEYLPHIWPSILLTSFIFLLLNGVALFYIRLIGKGMAESGENFRQLYENAPLPYQSLDDNGHFLDVNQTWLDTLGGYSKDEVIDRSFSDFLLPESRKIFENNFPRFKEKGKIQSLEFKMVKKDSSVILAHFTGKIAYDQDNNFLQTHSIFHDITAHRQTEIDILTSKQEWERTFDAMSDIVTIQDMDMHIIRINKKGRDTFDSTYKDILGKPCYELFHGSDEPCPECPLLVTKETFSPYTKVMTLDKMGKTFMVSASPVLDVNGKLTNIAHVAKDITDQKKMEAQLFLNEKMATIAGLAAGVAHEINTPLSAILQSLQLIEIGLSPDEPDSREQAAKCNVDLTAVHDYFKKNEMDFFMAGIRESALKASHIIKSLLDFSRPHEGSFSGASLEEIIDNSLLLAMADYDMKKKYDIMNVKIIKEFAPNLTNIICVAMEIEQVLLNLIKNSVQAMNDPGKEKKHQLTLRTSQKNKVAIITIEDNGPGMSDEVKKHIFDPFFTTKEVGTGTGLGLSVSHAIIVDKHKGKISVESEPGQGAKFIIELPVYRNEDM
jgi:PAS domain S-box-containing protein